MKILHLASLYWRTIKYLKPIQIRTRVIRKLFRTSLSYKPPENKSSFQPKAEWMEKPVSIINESEFIFLNKKAKLKFPFGWNDKEEELLWLYNLHYFDGLINNSPPKSIKIKLIDEWVNSNKNTQSIGWQSYPLSLRIVNWIKYDKKKENEEHFYLYIKRIREDLKFSRKINKKFYIKLEEANNIDLKKNLSKFLEINFHENILKATFAGKTWSGDKLSRFKSEDGKYNENVKKNDWENYFTYFDKKILNLIYNSYSSFGYSFKKITFSSFVIFLFTIPLPMSFEKIFFKPKYYFNKDVLIKHKFLNFYFYFKRILYFYLILLSAIKDKINEKTH